MPVDPFADEEIIARAWGQDPSGVLDVDDFLEALLMRPAWHRTAACRGMDEAVFFPSGGRPVEARAVCGGCLVQRQCLDAALAVDPASDLNGIFGGTTAKERAAMRRARAAAA